MSWEMKPVYTCAVCGKKEVGHIIAMPILGYHLMTFKEADKPWLWSHQGGPKGISVCLECRRLMAERKQ